MTLEGGSGAVWGHLSPARPGSARPGPAGIGSARLGPARPGSARLGSARLGSALLPLTDFLLPTGAQRINVPVSYVLINTNYIVVVSIDFLKFAYVV